MMSVKEFRSLHRLIDSIYAEALSQELTMSKLAWRAGLHVQTVERLRKYDTMFPRLQTVYLLAQAVGMELTLTAIKKLKRKAG